MCLTIYFDGQFWVGVFEESAGAKTVAVRRVLGAEPGNQEILGLVRHDIPREILDFIMGAPREQAGRAAAGRSGDAGAAAEEGRASALTRNPKRLAREAASAIDGGGSGTKAREAVKRLTELRKTAALKETRRQKEARETHKREIAKLKARKKHQGH